MLRTTKSASFLVLSFFLMSIDISAFARDAALLPEPPQTLVSGEFFFSNYDLGTVDRSDNVVQESGSLTVGNILSIVNGHYVMDGGTLNANQLDFANSNGLLNPWASIIQLDPITIPSSETLVDLEDFEPIPITELTFSSRTQSFLQESGEVSIEQTVNVQSGSLTIAGGSFSAESMIINGNNSTFRPTQFVQNGGESTFGSILIDDGLLSMHGGTLTADSLAMGDPASQSESFFRTPEFRQDGGNVMITGNLELCLPGTVWPNDPILIAFPFESVSYQLDEGNLDVGGNLIVGSMGAAPAEFTQAGGVNNVAGTLRIEGEGSFYNLQGGELNVGRLHIATDVFNTQGTFTMFDGATLHVDEEIIFGADANFISNASSTIHLSGGSFSILGSDESALSGLDNLSLIVGGSDEKTSLEVAGTEFGNVDVGFEMNFSLELLQIGNEFAADVELVNLIDNQLGSDASEALYVDTLHLTPGSTLDLNGLQIYYKELFVGEGANIIGDAVTAVPEPSSLLPLLLGMLAVPRSRKRVLARFSSLPSGLPRREHNWKLPRKDRGRYSSLRRACPGGTATYNTGTSPTEIGISG